MNAAKCIAALAVFCFCTAGPRPACAETRADGPVLVYHDLAQKAADREPRPREATFLPTGDLFKPLLADPKEPRFYLSYRLFKVQSSKVHGAAGGYGEIFGLYRRISDGGYSWQASFGGGIHAQFDLHAPSLDLVNTDYIIGFPFSLRKGPASYRFTVFHQSSHLGDEFLLHNNVTRVELSYEAIDAIGAYEWTNWRFYYGGGYMIHREPTSMKPAMLHSGAEYYATTHLIGKWRFVGGLDIKSYEENKWDPDASLKFGLQFDGSDMNGRYVRVLAEGYNGYSPYGQFYPVRMSYAGVGVYLGFE